MRNCRLDGLPVELIHHLLNYFSTHEIFHSLIHVTSYIDAILLTYSNYRVNFNSISRTNFDLVCQHVVPDQVMALTLSNGENTPGLMDLFLSRFQVNEFTHLQSLRLFEIGADFWETIITQMVELKHLRSFCFFSSDRSNSWICHVSPDVLTQLDKSLFERYAPVLPQLYQLRLCHGDYLNSIQFPSLRRLILERSTTDLIKHISLVAPQLELLETSFSDRILPKELIHPLPRLDRLVLRIKHFDVVMNDLERMMTNLPCLRHLELYANCSNDVVDGQRWQVKTKDLVTFRFLFHLSGELESHELDSFRAPFWLEEKHWFVAYTYRRFVSVPDLNPPEINQNLLLALYSTVPDNRVFYENINRLQLKDELSEANDYFPHVRTLGLSSTVFLLEKILDLSRVQHLMFSSSVEYHPVKRMINEMPNLRQITIRSDIQKFLEQVRHEKLEKIRRLHISNHMMHAGHYNIDDLCIVFSNIEHLQVDHKCSTLQIFDFLDRFKHLSTASFRYISYYDEEGEQQCRTNIKSTLDRVRRDQGLNYTCRFDSSVVHFWI